MLRRLKVMPVGLLALRSAKFRDAVLREKYLLMRQAVRLSVRTEERLIVVLQREKLSVLLILVALPAITMVKFAIRMRRAMLMNPRQLLVALLLRTKLRGFSKTAMLRVTSMDM